MYPVLTVLIGVFYLAGGMLLAVGAVLLFWIPTNSPYAHIPSVGLIAWGTAILVWLLAVSVLAAAEVFRLLVSLEEHAADTVNLLDDIRQQLARRD